MAILTDGPNGGFTGKAGSVVGYNRMGKWVIRGLPKTSRKNKIGTESQKASRSLFTKMQLFLSPIVPFIRVGFNMEGRSRQITAHNAAKSYNMLNAFTQDGEIDYAKILVSYGKLGNAINVRVVKEDTGLVFTWEDDPYQKNSEWNDQVMLLAYNVKEKNIHLILSGAKRNVGKETLFFDSKYKAEQLHTYIAFISDDRQSVSRSIYVGEIAY